MNPTSLNPRAAWYEIRVAEPLEAWWSGWFAGMEILPAGPQTGAGDLQPDGTLLRGRLPDQAALFGLLAQIRDLNLTLLEVRRLPVPLV